MIQAYSYDLLLRGDVCDGNNSCKESHKRKLMKLSPLWHTSWFWIICWFLLPLPRLSHFTFFFCFFSIVDEFLYSILWLDLDIAGSVLYLVPFSDPCWPIVNNLDFLRVQSWLSWHGLLQEQDNYVRKLLEKICAVAYFISTFCVLLYSELWSEEKR